MKHKVAIIGCGWVGKALTVALVKRNVEVIATTRSAENFTAIAQHGAMAIQLDLPSTNNHHFQFLANVHTLVISLTPQFKHGQLDYPDKVKQLVDSAKRYDIKRLVLLSSTGIYQGMVGDVDETTYVDIFDSKVALLNKAEQTVLNTDCSNCVLRLAGLVGPKRHPARFMAGKSGLANPKTPVNLVHQTDVVNAILMMIEQDQLQGIYNVVSDMHPTRQSFYQMACQQQTLVIPSFSSEQESQLRIIKGDKIKHSGLKLLYPDLSLWLQHE